MDHDVRRCWMQILFERISTFYWLGQVTEMFSLIDQLRPALEQYGAADQERRLHQLSAVALLRQLRYGVSWEAVNHASTFLQLTETAGNIAELPAAYFQLGFALLWANDLTSAEKEFGEALLLAERSA
ncbi:MAG: hypothetical protein EHM39_13695, partial [Chloroflexi bacterium]